MSNTGVRLKPRLNPVVFLTLFGAALMFDCVSYASAHGAFDRVLDHVDGLIPVLRLVR
jgi:hypothetical protein